MLTNKFRLVFVVGFLTAASCVFASQPALEQGFKDPAQEYGIRCWWWWLNGNVTREAITRDLEAMKEKGFSGACIFDAGGAEQRGNEQVPPGPIFGSREWTDLFVHAVETADRLGLVLSLSIQSGWNLGGPDVSPAEATKQLTWSETEIQSGSGRVKLPQPKTRDGFYRDIAVLAIPQKGISNSAHKELKASSSQAPHPVDRAFDGNIESFWVSGGNQAGQGPAPSKPEWILVRFAHPVTLGGIKLTGRSGYGPRDFEVQVSKDGNEFETVKSVSIGNGPVNITFEPRQASVARVLVTAAFDPISHAAPRNVQIAELSFLDAKGAPISLGSAPARIQNLSQKAVFNELGGSAPDTRFLLDDLPDQPGEPDARIGEVANLTGKLQPDGTLQWDPPAGRWTVLRFGYTCTGAHVSTSSGKWQGRVIDYMSEQHFRAYWIRHVEPLLHAIGPRAGKTLTHLQTDSWELGGINWTDNFAEEFRRRRGYDIIPYLPIIAGKVLDNRDTGTRFLADFRKTIGDCVSDKHYGVFAQMAAKYGMHIQPESAGPHAGPFDGLKNYQHSDIMMSEFWVPSPHRPKPEQRFFVKQASSAAHIYNKRLVGAESFTSIGPHWNDTFWNSQKPSFDHEMCSGLNLVLLHTFTCSPREMGLPGQEYFAGTHFNPQVTWWSMSDGFISYLRRCQFLAQQGKFIGDVLYYYGDHVPNIGRLKEDDPARVLPGYDYDLVSEDALLSLDVRDGKITLPHGQAYRLLVLPDHKVLSLEVARKVRQLVREGASVLGPKTERTVSLVSFPQSETELKLIADELWGKDPQPKGERKVGRGRVLWGNTAREVLVQDKLAPDFQVRGGEPKDYDYIHYTIGDTHCYFVCNQSPHPRKTEANFRIAKGSPELWDPLTGQHWPARVFKRQGELTTVPLEFEPFGSIFVLFTDRKSTPATNRNFPSYATLQSLEGPWDISFEPGRGAPARATLDKLQSWTENDEAGIKYFSGIGTYTKRFHFKGTLPLDSRVLLQLNDIRDVGMARVRLNGKDCGVAWTPPFQVDISTALQPGENTLEIAVANSWRNRLVGDRGVAPEKRFTKTNIRIAPEWELLPSGLFGPVELVVAQYD